MGAMNNAGEAPLFPRGFSRVLSQAPWTVRPCGERPGVVVGRPRRGRGCSPPGGPGAEGNGVLQDTVGGLSGFCTLQDVLAKLNLGSTVILS